MRLVLIGTDHRLQTSIVQDATTKRWVPRDGGHRYRKLLAHCLDKLGARTILEEAHPKQEETAPTIASAMAKERGLIWQSLGIGEPSLFDVLLDSPLAEAFLAKIKPEILAGVYSLESQQVREDFMQTTIMDTLREHDSVLAIVGFVHLGVLARIFEAEEVPVTAFLFTYPLVVDESRS